MSPLSRGGIGVIHTNLSIEDQAREVSRVKKFKAGFILDPARLSALVIIACMRPMPRVSSLRTQVCVMPTMTLEELDILKKNHGLLSARKGGRRREFESSRVGDEMLDQMLPCPGFTGFPVTENGQMGAKLMGLVTKRDTDFVLDRDASTTVT